MTSTATTTMPPSRKRLATSPPAESPSKRTAPDLPPAAPTPPVPETPPTDHDAESRRWYESFGSIVDALVGDLLNARLPWSEQRVPALKAAIMARAALTDNIHALEHYLEANGYPAVLHKSAQTDPAQTDPVVVAPPKHTSDASVATETPASQPGPAPQPTPPPRSYAHVAVGTPGPASSDPAPPPPRTRQPPPQTPRQRAGNKTQTPALPAASLVRLIVRPSPDALPVPMPFASILALGPSEPHRRLSHTLSLNPTTKDVKLLGVHQNRSKNLVVSLPPDTPESVIAAAITVARSALSPYPLPYPPPVVARDIPWSKLMVSSVPARSGPNLPTHNEADVMASFLQNPSIAALKVTRPSRWVRNPASITGAHSSFTFSFEDPDGSIARQLAKYPLFVFGAPVHLKRWTERSLQKRTEIRALGRSRTST